MTRSRLCILFGGVLLLCATETAVAQSPSGYELGLQASGSGARTPVQTEDLTAYWGGYEHGVMFAWRASLLNVDHGRGEYSLGAAIDVFPLERTRWRIQPIVGASLAAVGACPSNGDCGGVGAESTLSGGVRFRLHESGAAWLKVLVVSRKLKLDGWNDEHRSSAKGIVIGVAVRTDTNK